MRYRFTDTITFAGLNSFTDFGVTVKKLTLGEPEQITNRQSVPYMHGSYDFSRMAGTPTYKDRNLEITFNVIGKNSNDLYNKRIAIERWLRKSYNDRLKIDSIDYYCTGATCEKTEYKIVSKNQTVAELTAKFVIYPYLQSKDYGQQLWDEFNFDKDYLNLKEYVSESNDEYTEFTFFNGENETITPQVTFTNSTSSDYRGATMQIAGESGAYGTEFPLVVGTQTYTVASSGIIKFYPGYTNFKIKGLGSVSFSATTEVL